MTAWYMLTVVGADRPGIVARLTQALYAGGCNLGEASMMRLGGNFTIMLMARHDGSSTESMEKLIAPVADELALRIHIDPIRAELHQHVDPDVRVSVYGADRAGIVAEVTGALAGSGFNILDLESDVAGTEDKPIYVMHIEGIARDGIEAVRAALEPLCSKGVEVRVSVIDTMIG
jgi:glycine cleavage system transcriptional repressor